MLTINTQAPDFTLPDQDGKMHSLSDYKGRKVLPQRQHLGMHQTGMQFRRLVSAFQRERR